jgi:hypothetical protein
MQAAELPAAAGAAWGLMLLTTLAAGKKKEKITYMTSVKSW